MASDQRDAADMERVRVQTVPMPEECKKHHTELFEVDGVMYPPNTCARCGKWYPPYMAGVPTEVADNYCWGHQIEDALQPWKDATLALVEAWLAYDSDDDEREREWEADMEQAITVAKKLVGWYDEGHAR